MLRFCSALKNAFSGSDSGADTVVEESQLTPTSSAVAEPWTDSTFTDLREATADVDDNVGSGAVNVFVVENKQMDSTAKDSASHSDMKPLIVHHADAGFNASEPQDTTMHKVAADDVETVPFQADAADAAAADLTTSSAGDVFRPVDVDQQLPTNATATQRLNHVIEQPEPETAVLRAVETTPTERDVSGDSAPSAVHVKPDVAEAAAAGPTRSVVELSYSSVVDYYVSWFDYPWIVYLLVVVAATLLASATHIDPAVLIVGVLVACALSFLLFPPQPSDCVSDASSAACVESAR